MNLLKEKNGKKSEKTTSQKIILLSIIILVFLLIITIALILLLPKMNNTNIQRKDKIKINNEDTEITQGFVFIDETGKQYFNTQLFAIRVREIYKILKEENDVNESN